MADSTASQSLRSQSNYVFQDLPLIDFIKHDTRPTFILDLQEPASLHSEALQPVFTNQACYGVEGLIDIIYARTNQAALTNDLAYQTFKKWALAAAFGAGSPVSEHDYEQITWRSITPNKRWTVVTANFPHSQIKVVRTVEADSNTSSVQPNWSSSACSDDGRGSSRKRGSSEGAPSRDMSTSAARGTKRSFPFSGCHLDTNQDKLANNYEKDVVLPSSPSIPNRPAAFDTRLAKQNAELLAKIAAFKTVGIYITDMEGEILFCNDCWYEITQHPRELTNAMTWMNCFDEEEIPRITEIWRRVIVEQEPVQFEARLKRPWNPPPGSEVTPGGVPTWISAITYPDVSEDGETVGASGVLTDISEQKWMESVRENQLANAMERASLSDQLAARASEALESKRQLERFIDMTSHEIRNPLSAIIHNADDITTSLTETSHQNLSAEVIANAVEAAKSIMYCGEHSTRIVDDILTVSKLESKLLKMSRADARPVNTIREALKVFEGEMKSFDIKYSFIVDDSFDTLGVDEVYIDKGRVLQIFVNLITNAIKFTRPEAERRIDISMQVTTQRPIDEVNGLHYLPSQLVSRPESNDDFFNRQPLYIVITVSDTGCGITDEEMTRLFGRFAQAQKRTHVKYGGSGLGLYISRQLCEMHGGQIGLKSRAGKGSTFAFYIRTVRSIQQSNKDDSIMDITFENDISPGAQLKPVSDPMDFDLLGDNAPNATKKLTVLLVEDNITNQKVTSRMLGKQGYIVQVANHGVEALQKIRTSSLYKGNSQQAPGIDVILLDQEMPVMDGLTCIRHIRDMEEKGEIVAHIPVIAVTANARQEQIDEAKDAGMDDVLTKPFRMPQLFSLMSELQRIYPISIANLAVEP